MQATPPQSQPPEATVVMVVMCGARHVKRCLAALAAQQDAPPFEVIIAHDGTLGDPPPAPFPVRTVCEKGLSTVIDLAALGVRHARGRIAMLTEDHCLPDANWIRNLSDALTPDRSAVGGAIATDPDTPAVTWAFYFGDFFPYMPPIAAGRASAISVCNVAYRRADLESVRQSWEGGFHEPTVHSALQSRFGPLWLVENAGIRVRRDVSLRGAVIERFTQGRLFAADRVKGTGTGRSLFYALLAPILPALFLLRMAKKVLSQPGNRWNFVRAFPPIVTLVLAWCTGEWIGYLTRRPPQKVIYAPQVDRGA